MNDFLRLLGLARRHGAWFLLAMACMTVAAGATVFSFNLVRPLYDKVLSPVLEAEGTSTTPKSGVVRMLDDFTGRVEGWLQSKFGTSHALILGIVLMSVVLKNTATFCARYATARFGLATVRDVRNLIFHSLVGQSPSYFQTTATAVLVSRTTNDVQHIQEAFAERFGDLVQDLLTVLLLLTYLFSLDFRLTIATVLLAPLLLAPVVHFSRRLRIRASQAQQETGELATILDESVRGIRIVQIYGMAGFVLGRFRRVNHRQYLAALSARTIQIANAPVMEMVGATAGLGLIAYACNRISAGSMTLGDFSAFLMGAYGSYNPLKRLNKFNLALQQATVSAQRVFAVVDAPVAIRDRDGAKSLKGFDRGVFLQGVGFSYDKRTWVLRGLDLELLRGQVVALVGPSGAGKSTLAQLIPRFWDVGEGSVRIDDRDVRDIRLTELRSQIGLVTQETILFNDTVRRNIICGFGDISLQEMEDASRAADAHEFILALPQGYDTVIGEAGLKLSGGQRQRLAIARALLKDPPILILDEATSALDPKSELEVLGALDRLMCNRTTLVIAHRLATVRRADVIAVLDQGRVVERGTHDELKAEVGVYSRLVEMQELK